MLRTILLYVYHVPPQLCSLCSKTAQYGATFFNAILVMAVAIRGSTQQGGQGVQGRGNMFYTQAEAYDVRSDDADVNDRTNVDC